MPPKTKWEPSAISSDTHLKEICAAEQSFCECLAIYISMTIHVTIDDWQWWRCTPKSGDMPCVFRTKFRKCTSNTWTSSNFTGSQRGVKFMELDTRKLDRLVLMTSKNFQSIGYQICSFEAQKLDSDCVNRQLRSQCSILILLGKFTQNPL